MTDPKVIKFSKVFGPESIPESEATFKTPGMAQEMARRWNLHEELVGAFEFVLNNYPVTDEIYDSGKHRKLCEILERAKGGKMRENIKEAAKKYVKWHTRLSEQMNHVEAHFTAGANFMLEELLKEPDTILGLSSRIVKLQLQIAKLTEALKHIADGNYQITDHGRNYMQHNVVEELYSDKELKLWAQEILKSCEQYDEKTFEIAELKNQLVHSKIYQDTIVDHNTDLHMKINALESENQELKESKNNWMENCKFYQDKHEELLNEIAELESKIELMNKNCISLFLHEQRMAETHQKWIEADDDAKTERMLRTQTSEQLNDYQQVVDKYADGYIFDEPDDDTDQDLQKPWRHTSGKLARAMQSKWGE